MINKDGIDVVYRNCAYEFDEVELRALLLAVSDRRNPAPYCKLASFRLFLRTMLDLDEIDEND